MNPKLPNLMSLIIMGIVTLTLFASCKPEQPKPHQPKQYVPPSPQVIQQRQEAARKRAEELQTQEEIQRQNQLTLEKENSIYEITFIQIDRELNFRLYTLRHKRNNTEYLLVVTPEGSSLSPLLKP